MYNEQVLVDRLRTITGYSVELSSGNNIEMTQSTELPKLYVGHIQIRVENKEDWFVDAYRENDNNYILTTEINYLCLRSEWAETITTIREAYKGWSPFGQKEANASSITFVGAMLKGGNDKVVWWNEVVGLIYPRIT